MPKNKTKEVIKVTTHTNQISLFEGIKLEQPEPTTPLRVGSREIQIPLRKRRREACNRLMESLRSWRVRISTSAPITLAVGTSTLITSSSPDYS